MQELIIKKEHWRNLVLESCKTIIIISLKGFSLENNVSILSTKHKPPKCWFTERNGGYLVGLTQTQNIWLTKSFEVWNLRRLYFALQENEPLDNKKGGDRPRMDHIEQQSSKVQFLYCPIHSRIWSWKHAISHMNSIIWDVFWWWICLCFSSSMRQIFCPLFQHGKKLSEHTLTKCPVQQDSFLLVCGEVWTIVSWQNGLDNNRQYEKTVSVQSIY